MIMFMKTGNWIDRPTRELTENERKGESRYIMTAKELQDRIESLCTHVLFEYNGKEWWRGSV